MCKFFQIVALFTFILIEEINSMHILHSPAVCGYWPGNTSFPLGFRCGFSNTYMTFQLDGNLCIYETESGDMVWESKTDPIQRPRYVWVSSMVFQDDGNLCIYSASGVGLFCTYTVNMGIKYLSFESSGYFAFRKEIGGEIVASLGPETDEDRETKRNKTKWHKMDK